MIDKLNGIPVLSWIYGIHPIWALIVAIIVDYGIIRVLMRYEGLPAAQRELYLAFKWNDTIFIPLFIAVAVYVLRSVDYLEGFYTTSWWHWSVLAVGFAISLLMEYGAVRSGQFTMAQELSPSKMWHTIIFGVMFYWLANSVVIMFVVLNKPVWFVTVVIICVIGFGVTNWLDTKNPVKSENVHIEGYWTTTGWKANE